MSRMNKSIAAVSAALLLSAAGTFAVRAQDPVEVPLEVPAAEVPAAEVPAAPEEPARDPNAVVARAGDATITEGEVALAREAFSNELSNVPPEQWRSVLVDAVVNMELMAQGAREAGLDQGPEFQHRLDFLKLQALRNAYVEHAVVEELTEAELQEAYKTLVVAEHAPEQQVHARHILVDTEELAKTIIAELKGGAAFEELAKQSKDPSGQNGGDLGFFGKGQMVPPFETAAFALEPGQFTQEPVQSEFGWHVIKVEEKRLSEPPSFAEVEEQLRSYVLRQKFEQIMTTLRDKYPVEIIDPTAMPPAEPEVPAEDGAAPATETPDPAAEEPAAADEPAPAPEEPAPAPAN